MADSQMLSAAELAALVAEFAPATVVVGAVLLGSYARGQPLPYSDVDFERFAADLPATTEERYMLYLRQGRLISVTTTTIAAKRAEMEQPEEAIFAVPGLRQARLLLDDTGAVAALLASAHAFRWESLRARAEHWASEMVLGLAEEVHKLLNGLEVGDDYMLSNATHGLRRGAARAVAVGLGLLVASENEYEAALERAMGHDSAWTRSYRVVAGLDEPPISSNASPAATRALAALQLYETTAARLEDLLRAEHRAVIAHTRAAASRMRSARDAHRG